MNISISYHLRCYRWFFLAVSSRPLQSSSSLDTLMEEENSFSSEASSLLDIFIILKYSITLLLSTNLYLPNLSYGKIRWSDRARECEKWRESLSLQCFVCMYCSYVVLGALESVGIKSICEFYIFFAAVLQFWQSLDLNFFRQQRSVWKAYLLSCNDWMVFYFIFNFFSFLYSKMTMMGCYFSLEIWKYKMTLLSHRTQEIIGIGERKYRNSGSWLLRSPFTPKQRWLSRVMRRNTSLRCESDWVHSTTSVHITSSVIHDLSLLSCMSNPSPCLLFSLPCHLVLS